MRTSDVRQLLILTWACGTAAGLCIAQPPSVQLPTNVPAQTPPTPAKQPAAQKPSETQPPATAGQVDLRPKFRAGQVIRYVLDQTASNAVKSLDPNDTTLDQDQKQVQRIGLTMTVEQAGDEGATIKVVYESIKVKLETPDGTAEFDSTKPATKPTGSKPSTTPAPAPSTRPRPLAPRSTTPSPSTSPTSTPGTNTPTPAPDPLKDVADMDMNGMLSMLVGPMVGTTVTVKTNRDGAITSVSGGEALGGQMGGLGGLGGAMVPNPTAVANWLVAGVGGPNNRGMARVGETWTNNDALSGTPVGSFSMRTTHTLRSASGGSANVSFVGGIEPSSNGQPPSSALGQVQSASYSGNYIWDTRSGALAEMGTDMRVVLDGGLAGMRARMTSATTMKVRRQ